MSDMESVCRLFAEISIEIRDVKRRITDLENHLMNRITDRYEEESERTDTQYWEIRQLNLGVLNSLERKMDEIFERRLNQVFPFAKHEFIDGKK